MPTTEERLRISRLSRSRVFVLEILRNVASLPYLGDRKIHCSEPCFIHDNVQYFSVLNIDGKAKGITIKNAQYPLKNAEITWDYQYGISNQVLPGKTAEVTTQEGRLLLVKVYRE